MTVQEAVKSAKGYIEEVFDGEHLAEIGLEEVERKSGPSRWLVTIGFSRSIANTRDRYRLSSKRLYKIVEISDPDGEMLAIRNREISNV